MGKTAKADEGTYGCNVDIKKEGSMVTLTFDMAKFSHETEKSVVIASTKGNRDIGGGLKVGFNAYRSKGVAS